MPRFFVLSIWGICIGVSVLDIRIVGSRIYRIFALFCAEFAHEGALTATGMRTDGLKVR